MALAATPVNKSQASNNGGLTFALQALLSRHESYMASSEAERTSLSSQITTLEADKKALELQNANMVQQNRELLDHLEGMNHTIADSDAHIKSLAATLAEAQYEVRRLTQLAAKTADLERQLEEMEAGRLGLEERVKESEEEERSAVWRWKDAEHRLREMNEQVERIEKEARGERSRHEELVGRMDRRRELESAAGRLKGAAAATALQNSGAKDGVGTSNNGTNVVSHFVRDILQDNANLQAGIVELRELLQSSNEEVQNLREAVMLHQPVPQEGQGQQHTPLAEELEWVGAAAPRQVSQEVHVHHHYHAKFSTKKERAPLARRGSKKRAAIGGLLTPTPGSPMLGPPNSRKSDRSVSPAPLNTSMTTYGGGGRKSRWSVQSASTAMSSLPNSPPSYFNHRTSSIFDRIDVGSESSRPTSPESSGFASPQFGFGHRKGQVSEFSLSPFAEMPEDGERLQSERRVLGPPDEESAVSPAMEAQLTPSEHECEKDAISKAREEEVSPTNTINPVSDPPETVIAPSSQAESEIYRDNIPTISTETSEPEPPETESVSPFNPSLNSSSTEILLSPDEADPLTIDFEPRLCRSTSHESLVSISGMDIHIPRHSKSQLFALTQNFSSPSQSSSRPLASVVSVTASSQRSTSDSASSISLLSGLAATPSPHVLPKIDERPGLTGLLGGWVRGKWGIAPMASTGDLRAHSRVDVMSSTPPASMAGATDMKSENSSLRAQVQRIESVTRPWGINQKGAIPGLRPPVRTPSQVHARVLDEGLLRESLAES